MATTASLLPWPPPPSITHVSLVSSRMTTSSRPRGWRAAARHHHWLPHSTAKRPPQSHCAQLRLHLRPPQIYATVRRLSSLQQG
ncbi:hypothetical protein SESBI_30890 [Sesbania bispinosa]|nr:hypothetical protein SESBI_30890 [Sesbania bispinosa]